MEALHDDKLKFLEEKATQIREDIIKMLVTAGSGHSAGPLGMADVFTALYFHILNHRPQEPNWGERDRVVLSNGHICPVLYATLARAGYFPPAELKTLRQRILAGSGDNFGAVGFGPFAGHRFRACRKIRQEKTPNLLPDVGRRASRGKHLGGCYVRRKK